MPIPTELVYAFDIGPQRLTPKAALGLWNAGFRKAIIGLWYVDLDLTRSNLQVALDQGFDMESYAYLHLGGNVADRMQRSISLGLSYGVHRIFMDWEDDGEGNSGIPDPAIYPVSRVKDLIWTAQNACADYPNGHYSGPWWWGPVTGDAHDWAERPWWIADYDGNPDITSFTPMAGITTLTGKQYAGTHNVAGVDIDASRFLG